MGNSSSTTPSRPGWTEYFLGIAVAVSKRADCSRRRVGAVLVLDNRIVATGYNGAPSGSPGCLEGACPRAHSEEPLGSSYDTGPGACISIHAEANALLYADRSRSEGATMYVTHEPCAGCLKHLQAAGVAGVVYPSPNFRGRFLRRRANRGGFGFIPEDR